MSSGREQIYQSKAWKNVRLAYAVSKHCICERCGRPVYVSGVNDWLPKDRRLRYIVHHRTYITNENQNDESIVYDPNNLELLCIDCHNTEHKTSGVRQGLRFDDMGNLVEVKKRFANAKE